MGIVVGLEYVIVVRGKDSLGRKIAKGVGLEKGPVTPGQEVWVPMGV